VALPHDALSNAAIEGLIHPLDDFTAVMEDPDWYEYAREIAHLQDSNYGLPFAGDALVLVYRSSIIGQQPEDWRTALELAQPMAFPASDPEILVTLLHYQSLGGAIFDQNAQPRLDTVHLTEVLTYYHQASQSSLMPFWLTQYETDAQVWEIYLDNQADMVITWASSYLQDMPADSSMEVLPTFDGVPYTLGTGWAWTLTGIDPAQQALSAELAEFLIAGEFLAEWTAAAGYIPVRPSAAAGWNNMSLGTFVDEVAASARLTPSRDVLNILGPILQQAVVDVLKEQADPISAALTAVESLSAP
jgi:maltose-binding protein MalE